MKKCHAGEKVKIWADEEVYEGLLMPNEETDAVVIKLGNGYNIGIDRSRIKKLEGCGPKRQAEKQKSGRPPHAKGKKLITILHTGGTIASKVDYLTGGVIARFTPEELLSMFPELDDISNIDSWLISNMFSEDMRFAHYTVIAKEVKKAYEKGADGVIITHGTDTIGYTAAALSFIIKEPPIPIILVGAQRSSDRGSSDAAVNLICAARFIRDTDFAGVAICMHEKLDDDMCLLLPGTKTRKLHTSRRDAFKPVNDSPIASVSYKTGEIVFLKNEYVKRAKAKAGMIIKEKMEEKVGLVKAHPNIFPEVFSVYRKNSYKGLVIEGTGLGHAPVMTPNEWCRENEKNMKAIRELVESGCIVVMTSQAIFGRVSMHVYSTAIELARLGVVPGEDMLPETALVKLSWLLANVKDAKEVKRLVRENLAGEINERIRPEHFLS